MTTDADSTVQSSRLRGLLLAGAIVLVAPSAAPALGPGDVDAYFEAHWKARELEPASVRKAYGEGEFGQRCLMARRLVEAGVPAVEVMLDGWDTHEDNFGRTRELMGQLDPALSTLLAELAGRGLLERTLVVCMGEFGRKPDINGREGRDHHPRAFSVALAGGGVRGGRVVGATDAEGREVVARPVRVPDLFATFCKLLGIDPEQVFWVADRPITLVDRGKPVEELTA